MHRWSRSITTKETESIITSELFQILKQDILPFIYNVIEKIDAQGIHPSITITLKPRKIKSLKGKTTMKHYS